MTLSEKLVAAEAEMVKVIRQLETAVHTTIELRQVIEHSAACRNMLAYSHVLGDDIGNIQEKLKYLRESMTDYQQKLAEVMREETEARQALVDVLRDSEAAYKHTLEAYPEDEVPVDDYVEGDAVEEVVHRPGTPTKTLLRSCGFLAVYYEQ